LNELSLRQMRYVTTMADTGSISAAARALHVSQPTLSASLRDIEAALGITLFVRSRGRPLTATAEGRQLIPDLRRLVSHADDVHQRALGLADPSTGTVRLGSLVTIAPVLVAPLLRGFKSASPLASVTVTTGDQAQLLEGLRVGDLHMALTYDLNIDEGIEFVPLADVAPKVLLPATHELAGRRSLRLAELTAEPFILLDLPLSTDYFQAVFLAEGVSMRPAQRCRDLGLVRALVAEHLGYSVVNLVPASRGDDGLAYVPVAGSVPSLKLGVALSDRTLSAAAEEFYEAARSSVPRLLRTRANRR